MVIAGLGILLFLLSIFLHSGGEGKEGKMIEVRARVAK